MVGGTVVCQCTNYSLDIFGWCEEMDRDRRKRISESRLLLRNPYAYLNGEGEFDAEFPETAAADVHESRRVMQNQYAYLDDKGGYSVYESLTKSESRQSVIDAEALLEGRSKGGRLSKREVEKIAWNLQARLWKQRSEILPGRVTIRPLDVIDPALALESIGYSFELAETLGQLSGNAELFEVAGTIDNDSKRVRISRRFSPQIRNFTAAHELGHAILHKGTGLHRDRALDGSLADQARGPVELEADTFAAAFLMPEKVVRSVFQKVFGLERFVLNDETAFALTSGGIESLEKVCRTTRDVSRLLARAEQYDSCHFEALAKQFCVSNEAMAIRLEELNLV